MRIIFDTNLNKNYNIYNNYNNFQVRTKQIPMDSVSFSGKVKKQTNDEKFIDLRNKIGLEYKPLREEEERLSWDFYINSTDENMKKMDAAQEKLTDFLANPKYYEQLKAIQDAGGVKDKKLKKILKDMLGEFGDGIKYKKDIEALNKKESEISQKYNSYQYKIDGKEVTLTDIQKIFEKEENVEIRKKAYAAKTAAGDTIAEDLRELVKMRNAFAKKKGYKNFFEMTLSENYDIEPKALYKLVSDVEKRTKDANKKVLDKKKAELAKAYGISTDEIRDYHYRLLTKENPTKAINETIKTKEEAVEIAKKAYLKMGYDVDKLPITLDLFPRKNKNTHGFSFEIEYGKDARILANLSDDADSVETLLHELGHSVYTIKTDTTLPYFDQAQTSTMTEAVAMMMEDIQRMEGLYADRVSKKVNEKYEKTLGDSESAFVTFSMKLINFERSMYENPDQDLKKLWRDLDAKYDGGSKEDEPSNNWANIPHFLTHPAYYQNYFRASLIKAQLYSALRKKLGKFTENPKTAQYLNDNLFRYAKSKTDDELLTEITGKPLRADAFCDRINKLVK